METPKPISILSSGNGKLSCHIQPSVEIIDPKIEVDETPSRRITRSLNIITDGRDTVNGSPVSTRSQLGLASKKTTLTNKTSKRPIEMIILDPSSKKKKLVQHYRPQEWDFYVNPGNRFSGSINVFYRFQVIQNLNHKLNAKQKEIFKASCFGHFLRLSEIRLQHPLIHKLLLLEVRQAAHEEMWFNISGRFIKFSIEEFCLSTGLKCDGDDNINKFKMGHCRLKENYFKNLQSVSRKDVERVFMRLPEDTPDEDVVKLGILYMISTFLFTSTQPKMVSNATMRLIDSPYLNSFPWGKDLFHTTFFYLKMAFAKRNPNSGETRGTMNYRLQGFPLAFQIWIYESIPVLCGKVCTRIDNSFPRIINWCTDERVTASSLEKILSDLDEHHEVGVISPTKEEKEAQYFIGLLQSPRQRKSHNVGADFCNDPIHSAKDHNTPTNSNAAFFHCSSPKNTEYQKVIEPTIISLFEDLLNHVHEIKLKQEEILDFQVDMKTDIYQLQRFNEIRYELFMDELRKKSNTKGADYKSDRAPFQTKAGLSDQTEDVEDRMRPKSSNNNAHDAGGVPIASAQVSNVVSQAKLHPTFLAGNRIIEQRNLADEFEDIQFTEDDLNKVDDIVNSARTIRGKSKTKDGIGSTITNQDDFKITDAGFEMEGQNLLGILDGTIPDQHNDDNLQQQDQCDKLPNQMSPAQDVQLSAIGSQANTRYNMYAFKEGLALPGVEDVATFEDWIRDGYRSGHIKIKFPYSKDIIQPPYQFGPFDVDAKTWWYELWHINVNLRDTHLNVCFYYFRKMIKFGHNISFNGTTIDSFFGDMVRYAYRACKVDHKAISSFKSLIAYATGEYLHCNNSWVDVEHILIPIMMETKAHWILGHFDIKQRCLNIYNSSRLTIRDRMVMADVEAFAYVLPCLMFNINAWLASYLDGSGGIEPLVVNIDSQIPQDGNGQNCGVYVMKYAEFIINGKINQMAEVFDPKSARISLACQLFKYGNQKRRCGYETDMDVILRSVGRARKGKMIEIAESTD